MKKLLFLILSALTIIVLAACSDDSDTSSSNTTEETKKIKLGATAGPYSDMLSKAIIPQLEEKGYEVELTEFSDYVQPNIALNNGDIDANLFQHSIYLENFEKENDMDLEALIIVPTAPMGFFSKTIKSVDDIPDGATIAIPNDPSNAARTLATLAKQGLIEISPDVEELKASEKML